MRERIPEKRTYTSFSEQALAGLAPPMLPSCHSYSVFAIPPFAPNPCSRKKTQNTQRGDIEKISRYLEIPYQLPIAACLLPPLTRVILPSTCVHPVHNYLCTCVHQNLARSFALPLSSSFRFSMHLGKARTTSSSSHDPHARTMVPSVCIASREPEPVTYVVSDKSRLKTLPSATSLSQHAATNIAA